MNSGGNAAVNSQLVIDADGSNADNGLQEGLVFGNAGSGEGILSNRAEGSANKWGIELVTAYAPRVSVTNDGKVGINQRNPMKPLHVEGGETHSAGDGAGYSFMNRQTPGFSNGPGERWVLYGHDKLACLWSGSADRILIDENGCLGTRGYHPTAGGPGGWGMGLHTWDIYAEATIAAGRGGQIAAYMNSGGDIVGRLKRFQIDHPLFPGEKYLVHAAIEGPEYGVYYRGEARLEGGVARVELPAYFEKLVRADQRTVQITPKLHGEEAGGSIASTAVENGVFTARGGTGTRADQGFFWEVKAVRADTPAMEVEPPHEYQLETAGTPVEPPAVAVDPAAAQVETPPPPPELAAPDIGPPPEPELAPVVEVQTPPPVEPPPPPPAPDTPAETQPPTADAPPVEAPPGEPVPPPEPGAPVDPADPGTAADQPSEGQTEPGAS
jgi:hypothetical protein